MDDLVVFFGGCGWVEVVAGLDDIGVSGVVPGGGEGLQGFFAFIVLFIDGGFEEEGGHECRIVFDTGLQVVVGLLGVSGGLIEGIVGALVGDGGEGFIFVLGGEGSFAVFACEEVVCLLPHFAAGIDGEQAAQGPDGGGLQRVCVLQVVDGALGVALLQGVLGKTAAGEESRLGRFQHFGKVL